jgi:hypothetical protein
MTDTLSRRRKTHVWRRSTVRKFTTINVNAASHYLHNGATVRQTLSD